MLLAQECGASFNLIGGGVVAIVFLALLLWGLMNPLVWRLLAVIGMGTGVGLLVWGIMLARTQEQAPIGSPAGIAATGAGFLAGAIVLLVVSFVSGRTIRKE